MGAFDKLSKTITNIVNDTAKKSKESESEKQTANSSGKTAQKPTKKSSTFYSDMTGLKETKKSGIGNVLAQTPPGTVKSSGTFTKTAAPSGGSVFNAARAAARAKDPAGLGAININSPLNVHLSGGIDKYTPNTTSPFRRTKTFGPTSKELETARERSRIVHTNNADFLYDKNGTLKKDAEALITAGADMHKSNGGLSDIIDVTTSRVRNAENPGIADSTLGPEAYTDAVTFRLADGRTIETRRGSYQYKNQLVNFLDAEKQSVYYYLLGKGDMQGAEEYLDRWYNSLDNAVMTKQFSKDNPKRFAEDHPVLAKAARPLVGMGKAMEGMMAAGGQLLGIEDDITDHTWSNTGNQYTEAERERIKNPFLQYVNDGVNMLLETSYTAPWNVVGGAGGTALARIAHGVSNASMGLQSYSSEINNEIQNGTYGEKGSVTSPAVKSALQMMSFNFISRGAAGLVGKLIPGKTGLQRFVASEASRILEGGLVNASQTVLGEAADAAIRGRYSDYQQTLSNYIAGGMNEDAARKKAAWETFVTPAYQSAVVGGLMAGVTGIKGSYEEAVSFAGYGRYLTDKGIDPVAEGLKFEKNTEAYKYAERMSKKDKVSDNQLGIQGTLNDIENKNIARYAGAMDNLTGTVTRMGETDPGANEEIQGRNITISETADEPVAELIRHAQSHRIQDLTELMYSQYLGKLKTSEADTSNLFDTAVGEVKNLYERNNKPMTERLAEGEVAADLARHFIKNTKAAERVQRMADGDMRITDMAYNAIKDLTARMKALGGKRFRDNLTGLEFTYTELREIEKFYEQAAAAAGRKNSGEGSGDVRYSIADIKGSNGDYGVGVYLDTNIFNGVKTRDWNKTLAGFVKNNLAGKAVEVFNDDGSREIIRFADKNERVIKDGSDTSRKVIDKLARTKGNANMLSIVHINELLETASIESTSTDNSHQWLDANGWEYRKAYVQDINGKIYETTLNIANTRDGRQILYALSNTKKIDAGVVPSAQDLRGARTRFVNPKDIIPQPDSGVKKFSLKNTPQTESENFKRWFGDWESDPENASKVVNEDGTPMVLYHGTDADFTVFDRTKGRSSMDIQGMFFSPWEIDAGGYGNNVGAYYLNIKNPASGEEAFKALNKFKGQNYAGIKAREYLENQGYDGVNFYDEEFVAFYPTQIKSATDNIGTFDGSDPDIRYSLKRAPGAEPSRAEENHTPEQLKVMQEYEDAVDKDILEFAKYARANPKDNRTSITLSEVTPKAAADIQRITGIDVEGFEHSIKANTIRHIDDGHGANGSADRSMSDDNDIARIQYVLDNYDHIELLPERSKEYRDKNQNPTPVVKYSKRVDGTYYAVEAVPDTKKHQLAVITAYKNKAAEQQTVSASNPLPDVRNASADAAYNNSISHSNQKSNTFSGNDSAEIADPREPYIKKARLRKAALAASEATDAARQEAETRSDVQAWQNITGEDDALIASESLANQRRAWEQEAKDKVNSDIAALMEERGASRPAEIADRTPTRNESKKSAAKPQNAERLRSRLYTMGVDDMHPFFLYAEAAKKAEGLRAEDWALSILGKSEEEAEKAGKNAAKNELYGKDNPYKLAINSKDATGRAAFILTDKLIDYDNNFIGDGLFTTLEKSNIGENYDAFGEYLVARHALEWITPNGDHEPKQVYSDPRLNNPDTVRVIISDMEAQHPEFVEAAQNVYDWYDEFVQTWLVDTGLVSESEYAELRRIYPNYVPFMRERGNVKFKTGAKQEGSPFKYAAGSAERIYDPIENIMYNVGAYVDYATRNEVKKSAVRLYDMYKVEKINPLAEYWQEINTPYAETSQSDFDGIDERINNRMFEAMNIRDGNVVTVMEDGKRRYFRVNDKEFLRALDNLTPKQLDGILSGLAAFSRVRAALLTSWKPKFALMTNPERDLGTFVLNTTNKSKIKAMANVFSSLGDTIKYEYDSVKGNDTDNYYYAQYKAAGGEGSQLYQAGADSLKRAMKKFEINPKTGAEAFFKAIGSTYATISDAIEANPRKAEFMQTLKEGYDYHEAIYRAKDVTVNFSRGGRISKEINAVSNFFNASIQGVDKYARTAKNNPIGFAAGTFALALPSIIKYAWNRVVPYVLGDDEEKVKEGWENLSNYKKNNMYNFYCGDGKFFSIYKPRESSALVTLFEAAIEHSMMKEEDRFKDFFSDYIMKQFLPDGNVFLWSTITDILAGKDYRDMDIIPYELQDLPKELQYDDNTSYLAIGYAKTIGRLGAKLEQSRDQTLREIGKLFNVSPKNIDYFIKEESGVIGDAINKWFTPNGFKETAAHPWKNTLGVVPSVFADVHTADSVYSTDKTTTFYENKEVAKTQLNGYPSADNQYLYNRYDQAGQIMTVINGLYKEEDDREQAREVRRSYVNFAKANKDNPTGYRDEVYAELKDLYDTDKSVLSMREIKGVLERTVDGKKETYKFDTVKAVKDYQEDLNRNIEEAYIDLFNSVEYNSMSKADKVKALKKARDEAGGAVKDFYIENKGKKRFFTSKSTAEIKKPGKQEIQQYAAEQEYIGEIENHIDNVANNIAAKDPDSGETYSSSSLTITKMTSTKIGDKEYAFSADLSEKITKAANDRYYKSIEQLENNEVTLESILGYAKNGKAHYSKDLNGKRKYLSGKLYNADGSPRFDELVMAKIYYKAMEEAKEYAIEQHKGEITGEGGSDPGGSTDDSGDFSPEAGTSGDYSTSDSGTFKSSSRRGGGRRGGRRGGGGGRTPTFTGGAQLMASAASGSPFARSGGSPFKRSGSSPFKRSGESPFRRSKTFTA